MNHFEGASWSSCSCAAVSIGVVAAAVTLGACANQPPPSPPPSTLEQVSVTQERYGSTMMQPSGEGPGRAAVAGSSTERAAVSEAQLAGLDDAHLAGLVEAVSDSAMRSARVGESRVTDRAVKRFAHDMATTHVAAQNRLRARLKDLGIEAASSPLSEQVRADAGSGLAMLSARGQGFDLAYVEGQVRDLTWATEVCRRVVEHVESPELRDAIERMRSKLEANVGRAQSLDEALRAGTTNLRPDAYDPDKVQH